MQDPSQQPKLVIEVQPCSTFRCRYDSEIRKGRNTHGVIQGPNRGTYPTVKLTNFIGDAIIRCSLRYENGNIHSYELRSKSNQTTRVVNDRTGYRAEFEDLCIIVTLQERNEAERMEVKTSKLCFEAFELCDDKMNSSPICFIHSNTITHSKTASTLKITGADVTAGPCTGGTEMWVLTNKVRADVQVRFFGSSQSVNPPWTAKGSVDKVHHGYTIILRTPKYADAIHEDVDVNFELFYDNSEERSNYMTFKYLALRPFQGINQVPLVSSSTSGGKLESGFPPLQPTLPPTLPLATVPTSQDFLLETRHLPSSSSQTLEDSSSLDWSSVPVSSCSQLSADDPAEYLMSATLHTLPDLDMDTLEALEAFLSNNPSDAAPESQGDQQDMQTDSTPFSSMKAGHWEVKVGGCARSEVEREDIAAEAVINLRKLVNSGHPYRQQELKKTLSTGFGLLHSAAFHGQLEELKELLILIIQNKMLHLIDCINNNRDTPLMIAAAQNRANCVLILCTMGAKISHDTMVSDTALHIAVMKKHHACLQHLLRFASFRNLVQRNARGETALDIARANKDRDSEKLLLLKAYHLLLTLRCTPKERSAETEESPKREVQKEDEVPSSSSSDDEVTSSSSDDEVTSSHTSAEEN